MILIYTGGSTEDVGNTGAEDDGNTPTVEKKSFLEEFCDVDTMFEYLERISAGEVNKSTGISRAQLIHLTQNEQWEDDNYNFWATLNRIFNFLDTDKDTDSSFANDVLSYDEIKAFIGEELGEDVTVYLEKVNEYANELQNTYSKLSDQEKLNFVIERTREYFESKGLTKQINALDRLTTQNDTANFKSDAIKVGQIVLTDISSDREGLITLGAYSSMGYPWIYEDEESPSKPYTVSSFATDQDDVGFDGGITLNKILLERSWYELVNTLVHELTHATASQWYPDPPSQHGEDGDIVNFNFSQVEALREIGVLTDAEYDFYFEHWSTMFKSSATEEEDKYFYRLMYLLECQWGEYAAYQTDADYVDSIAGDIFNCEGNMYGNNKMTTAVSGADEVDIITEHIEKSYDTAGMSIADYAKAYNYDVSDILDKDGNGIISYGDTVKDAFGRETDIYSRESKLDYEWATYNKNQGWSWSA